MDNQENSSIKKSLASKLKQKISNMLKSNKKKEYKQSHMLSEKKSSEKKSSKKKNVLDDVLENVSRQVTDGTGHVVKETQEVLKKFGDIFGINGKEKSTEKSREKSSRTRSDRVSSSRLGSVRVSSSRLGSVGVSSKRETIVVIDRGELMMNNLNIIFKCLSENWSSYIGYIDKKNNNDKYTIKINMIFFTLDISFLNITELVKEFKKQYTNKTFFRFASSRMINLLDELNKSNDEKISYDIIIQIMRLFIAENRKKSSEKEKAKLNKLETEIDGLEKIRGGKLRKVRKTNVIKKRTNSVIKKYKK